MSLLRDMNSTRISKNFILGEMLGSDTATANMIENAPRSVVEAMSVMISAAALAHNCLQPLRDQFGVLTINSWYRCEELEKIITKGAFPSWCERNTEKVTDPKSWDKYFARKSHPRGEAADVEAANPRISNVEVFNWAKTNLKFDQLILENVPANSKDPRAGWVHISYREGNNRQEAFQL